MTPPQRILVVDDNPAIHEAFRKILTPPPPAASSDLDRLEAELFGAPTAPTPAAPTFELVHAHQGAEAIDLVAAATAAGKPFGAAFVDIRMPPGLDGVQTTERLWAFDPELQVVICTAFNDYSWEETIARLGHGDGMLILKKPFDAIEVRQLASALTRKRELLRRLTVQLASEVGLRESTEEELRRALKLEAVGQLAAGVAHEINTPIQYVGNNIDYVQDAMQQMFELLAEYKRVTTAHLPQPERSGLAQSEQNAELDVFLEEVPDALRQSAEGVERVAEIVRALKAMSHPGNGEKSATEIDTVVRNAVLVSAHEHKMVADVHIELGNLPRIQGFPNELGQVCINLIVNACHAIAETDTGRGRIDVTTSVEGGNAVITIRDNGPGIPKSAQHRIFEPFFTTKEVGKGTGQGLALCHRIVERHGGRITFETSPSGTTFRVALPICPDAMAA